jgi:hypothetical protein
MTAQRFLELLKFKRTKTNVDECIDNFVKSVDKEQTNFLNFLNHESNTGKS